MHGRAELVNSIALAVFRKDLPSNAGDAAIADLHADLAAGRLFLADVPWRRTFDRATELSCANTPRFGTRTLDVLHVATATVIGCTSFVTYDTRQAKLARAVGLRTTAP